MTAPAQVDHLVVAAATLDEGVRYERRVFLSLFGTPDQKEGMAAFAEKRKPQFGRG